MNIEDYVSLEVAKLLKEKGFDEECELAYETDVEPAKLVVHCMPNHRLNYGDYACPTLWQAQKWLRKGKGIHIVVNPYYSRKHSMVEYYYKRMDYFEYETGIGEGILSKENYEDYGQCLNDAILDALKRI